MGLFCLFPEWAQTIVRAELLAVAQFVCRVVPLFVYACDNETVLRALPGLCAASCSCLVVGDARFSVLTPSVIRMEHHAGCTTGGSGCFDDEVCVCSPDPCWPALLLTPRAALS